MVIAVTGSKGFIGSYLVNRLKDIGYDLIEVDTKNGFDVTNKDDMKRVQKFDCIIHLAGKVSVPESFRFTYDYLCTNFLGTTNVLELCRKYNAKMIFAGSYIYGSPKYLPIDESHPLQAHNPYTQSKIIGEQLCQLYNRDFGISCVSLRQFNVYGPKMRDDLFIPTILKQARSGKIYLNDIRPQRDYIYVEDLVEAYVACIKYENTEFETFNIATGISYSVEDIINILRCRISNDIQIIDLNTPRLNEILEIVGNNNKAKIKLGWEPKINFVEGIDKLIDYYDKYETSTSISNYRSQTNIIDRGLIPLSVLR